MGTRFPMTRIPELTTGQDGRIVGHPELVRIANQNFRAIRDQLERAQQIGGLIGDATVLLRHLASEAKANSGDVSGTHPAHTVIGLHGHSLAAPAAGDDGKAVAWDNGAAAWAYTALLTDHGAFGGLADDDHPQYSLADGTRAFSGVVSGVTPTNAAHLATKQYVDDSGGGGGTPPGDFDLLTDGVSSLVFAGGDVVWIT